jgi:hypothetical protein
MITQRDIFLADHLRLPELGKGILFERLRWLIVLRWFAIIGIVLVGAISRYSVKGGTKSRRMAAENRGTQGVLTL